MANKILKFGIPTISQAIQSGSRVRHQTGACGIQPLKPPPRPQPEIPPKFPDHLLRPPCMPGSETGRYPPGCLTYQGYYCPTERIKYKYPPFSENIDFVPSGEPECWWARPRQCNESQDVDEELKLKL